MASLSRRISSVLLAAAMIGSLVEPALAQVSPAMPTVGPAGGTASTTSPSNQDGTPAGGTGVIGQTRPGSGGGANDGRIVLNPQQNMDQAPAPVARRQARNQRRVARSQARRANQAAVRGRVPNTSQGTNTGTGAGSAAGLNNSNAPSR